MICHIRKGLTLIVLYIEILLVYCTLVVYAKYDEFDGVNRMLGIFIFGIFSLIFKGSLYFVSLDTMTIHFHQICYFLKLLPSLFVKIKGIFLVSCGPPLESSFWKYFYLLSTSDPTRKYEKMQNIEYCLRV